ncbi:MAG: hybrid sensor histidine kinase/response regulator [Candidatus Cloacimonadota bacterium]|nr:MAG: hybrid sensor histidine kinase/response regulator [Candidatus Cloacimonadota bacterium]
MVTILNLYNISDTYCSIIFYLLITSLLLLISLLLYLKKRLLEKTLENEENLKKSESHKNFNEELIKNIPGGFLLISEDYVITKVNQRTCDITGFSEKELLGNKCDVLCPKGQKSKECPIWIKGLTRFNGMDTYINRKNKVKCPILKNAQILEIEGKKYILESFNDITDLKEAEEKLEESNKRLYSLFTAMEDLVLELDRDGRCLYVAPTSPKVLSVPKEELLNKTLYDVLEPDLANSIQEKLDLTFKRGVVSEMSYSFIIDGKEHWFESIVSPKSENSVILFVRDITERKKSELELQKLEQLQSLGTLAGGIAHDFNNILTGIYGNFSLAKFKMSQSDPAYEFLDCAEKSMHRATKLTRQLLTFSKGGSPVKDHVCLFDLIAEVVKFDLTGSNVKPKFDYQENLWEVDVDKGQIEQVFSNLTINANQAMPNGGCLYFSMFNIIAEEGYNSLLQPGYYVKVTVKDEGNGIDVKDLPHIFEPYFTTKETGNGIGLATVYSIIRKHNGMIDVHSELNVGTAFDIYLPASGKSVSCGEKSNIISENLKIKKNNLHVLVMDDEEIIRGTARNIFTLLGHTADTAEDGKRAVEMYKEAFKKNPYDLVIMDLTVPGGMGGMEAVRQILDFDKNAFVFVSSGYSDSEVIAKYEKYGFKNVIEKPYTIEKMQETLNKYA